MPQLIKFAANLSNFQSAAWSICDWWSWRTALHLVDPARSAMFEDIIIPSSEELKVRLCYASYAKRVTLSELR